jgi:hypothetical protein
MVTTRLEGFKQPIVDMMYIDQVTKNIHRQLPIS